MQNLSTEFLTALRRQEIDDLFLLAVLAPPPGVSLPVQNLSLVHRSLTWGPSAGRVTYVLTGGEFDSVGSTLDSEPPGADLTLENLDGTWYRRLNRDRLSLNGSLLTFLTVFASVDPSDEATSLKSRLVDGPYTISGARLGDTGIRFGFGLSTDVLGFKIPAVLSRGRRCPLVYKGPYCKSASALPTCSGTISECAERHGAVLRFGTWPFSDPREL